MVSVHSSFTYLHVSRVVEAGKEEEYPKSSSMRKETYRVEGSLAFGAFIEKVCDFCDLSCLKRVFMLRVPHYHELVGSDSL